MLMYPCLLLAYSQMIPNSPLYSLTKLKSEISGSPSTVADLYDIEPLRKVISYHYSGVVVLPLRDHFGDDVDEPRVWEIGYRWTGRSSRHRAFLYKLGLLGQEKEFCTYFREEGLERLLNEYFDPGPPVYTYELVDFVPYHLRF